MCADKGTKRIVSLILALIMVIGLMPVNAFASEADDTLTASLEEAKAYIDGITINNSSNDPATVVQNFKTHFTWDNEKRENSKSYLFDWSYYNGVVFEGIEFVYEVTGEEVYKDYVIEYMSSLITSSGSWATCSNNSSKQCAGYNATHGADCYKTASLLLDAYEMTGDSRYLTMADTLYADLDSAAKSYSLSNAGQNFRHTWASDPSPDLWLDGLYMILPFRAEYAKYIGDTEELDLIVDRMQWVSDNMYNSSKGLFYHAADSASSNSGTYWLRSIGWYAAAIVDIMDSMEGENLEAMKAQLVKLVDGMKACQNASNGMWLNNMNASQSSSNPYETSGTALTCYAVMKAVNNGWLDESYADMAILAFNGICNEKLSGSTLTDICFKGAPGSSNSTFYDNEGKGVGPFIMFYAEMLEYVNNYNSCEHVYESVTADPTCAEEGSVTYTCTLCGDSYAETLPATGEHVGETTTVDATCTEDGSVTTVCTVCGQTAVETLTALGHAYDCVITEATTERDGTAVYTCVRCGHSYTETIPATGGWIGVTGGNVYVLDTDGVDVGEEYKYIILGSAKDYALTLSGSTIGSAAVTVEDDTITLEDASAYEFYFSDNASKESGTYLLTQDGSKTVYHANGNMYYGSDSKGYWYFGSHSNGAYQIYDYDNLNWYLNYGYVWSSESVSRFAVSSNTRTVRLFRNAETYARLRGTTVQSYTDAEGMTEAAVLERLYIETSADGENVSGTVAMTDDMITWDTAFDGAVPGTYTGMVNYQGTAIGTVTVTIASAHSYESQVVAPTCAEGGYTVHTCTDCGDSYTDSYSEALGHSYEAVVTAPTCTDAGFTTNTCERCGECFVSDETAALGHRYETVTVEATCTEDGSVTTACTRCDESTVEVIGALGHSYEAVVTAPTCTEEGYTTYTCACGDSYVSDQVAATGHDYETVVTAPTCTEEGYTTYTCACGDSYVSDQVAATGHDYETVVTAPTCTEEGYTTYTCACGDSYVSDQVAAMGHNYESVVTAPTCTENGFTTHTCTLCGDVTVDTTVEALGHDHEIVTVAATCAEDGSVTTTCTLCGETTVEVIDALGHDYETVVTEPTCTEGGYTTNTCQSCGTSTISDETAALGHRYETVTVDATCTEAGSVAYTCACGHSYTEVIEALGHSYEAVVTEPTCTEEGYTTYTCACGDSYVSDQVAALGHDYEAVVTEPTCTEAGYTTYICACGDSYVSNQVAALGHDYETVVTAPTCTEEGYTTYTCACGDSYVSNQVAALGHDYEAVVTEPTCTEEGYTTYTCACGDSYVSDETAAPGHSYTCVEDNGCLIYTCGSCGDSYSESVAWISLSGRYVLDTDGIDVGEAHKYIVVGSDQDYALTLSGSTIGSAAVTVEDNTITLEDASAYEFYFSDNASKESGTYLLTQDGAKGIYHMGGNMYYGSDSKGYWYFGSHSNGAYQIYDYDNLNWYLNYGYVWSSESVSRFAVSSNARTVRLFKAAESFVRLAGEMNQTCTDADGMTEAAVLEKVLVQLSIDGETVSETLALTAEMVTWDVPFDGTTPGTYTAAVTYQGVELGTLVVTVTSEHVYETTVVAPTCTEQGYTLRVCGECGVSYKNAYTEALGHSYSCVESEGYLVYTCSACGDSYSEKAVSFTQVSGISSGNDYVITVYSGGKYYALSHGNNRLSAVEVSVSGGEITSEVTSDLLWTYSGSKLSYTSGSTTYYLYAYSSGWGGWWGSWWGTPTLSLSTSNSSSVSLSGTQLKVGSYYLTYSGGITVSQSAGTAYLYAEN